MKEVIESTMFIQAGFGYKFFKYETNFSTYEKICVAIIAPFHEHEILAKVYANKKFAIFPARNIAEWNIRLHIFKNDYGYDIESKRKEVLSEVLDLINSELKIEF
jgi:hypothetical protein